MGCNASKPGLVDDFRADAKPPPPPQQKPQLQPPPQPRPTLVSPVQQPAPARKENQPPGFFDANLTFANVNWQAAVAKKEEPKKPSLRLNNSKKLSMSSSNGGPKKEAPSPQQVQIQATAAKKAAGNQQKQPQQQPQPQQQQQYNQMAYAQRPPQNLQQMYDEDDWYDEDESDYEDGYDPKMVDPDMFVTRVNNANFNWEGKAEHSDVLPRRDTRAQPLANPFAGMNLSLADAQQAIATQKQAQGLALAQQEAAQKQAKQQQLQQQNKPSQPQKGMLSPKQTQKQQPSLASKQQQPKTLNQGTPMNAQNQGKGVPMNAMRNQQSNKPAGGQSIASPFTANKPAGGQPNASPFLANLPNLPNLGPVPPVSQQQPMLSRPAPMNPMMSNQGNAHGGDNAMALLNQAMKQQQSQQQPLQPSTALTPAQQAQLMQIQRLAAIQKQQNGGNVQSPFQAVGPPAQQSPFAAGGPAPAARMNNGPMSPFVSQGPPAGGLAPGAGISQEMLMQQIMQAKQRLAAQQAQQSDHWS